MSEVSLRCGGDSSAARRIAHYSSWSVPSNYIALMGARAARAGVMLRQVEALPRLQRMFRGTGGLVNTPGLTWKTIRAPRSNLITRERTQDPSPAGCGGGAHTHTESLHGAVIRLLALSVCHGTATLAGIILFMTPRCVVLYNGDAQDGCVVVWSFCPSHALAVALSENLATCPVNPMPFQLLGHHGHVAMLCIYRGLGLSEISQDW